MNNKFMDILSIINIVLFVIFCTGAGYFILGLMGAVIGFAIGMFLAIIIINMPSAY